jgi:hypothetical protein
VSSVARMAPLRRSAGFVGAVIRRPSQAPRSATVRSQGAGDMLARNTLRRGHTMAVGIRLKFAGGTQEQYQAVHDTVNASSPLGRSDGLLVHSAGPIDGGWGVIDFWESAEAFDRFTQNKLMPVIQQLGDRAFPNPPERKDFTVHNLEQHGD